MAPTCPEIDVATGALSATIPLEVAGEFAITFTNSDSITSQMATEVFAFEGNADATITYLPTITAIEGNTILTLNSVELLTGASDIDGDALSITGVTVSSGTLDIVDGSTWTFTPDADDTSDVSFSYSYDV